MMKTEFLSRQVKWTKLSIGSFFESMFLCFISCMSAREEDTLKKITKTAKNIQEKVPKSLKFYFSNI